MKTEGIARFSGFEKDEYYTGIIEFSEETLNEMRRIVKNDFDNIKIDLEEQLYRLDAYLKAEGYPLPRTPNFVKWFFDKKKITQMGKNLPKVPDNELIDFVKEYKAELDKLLSIKNPVEEESKAHFLKISIQKKKQYEKDKSYSQKQIAIAYYIMGITITEENAKSILEKHSKTKSMKILQKLVTKSVQLTSLLDTKTANTKHLNDLKAAKRLVSGIKNKTIKHPIDPIITAFQTSYNSKG